MAAPRIFSRRTSLTDSISTSTHTPFPFPSIYLHLLSQAHHESKHEKLPWDPSLYEDVQAKHGGTTQGVAVRGTTNAKKLKVRGGGVKYVGYPSMMFISILKDVEAAEMCFVQVFQKLVAWQHDGKKRLVREYPGRKAVPW